MHADQRAKESAARIRAVRNYKGMTQGELADRLGISLATMKRYESGERPISTEELLAIAEAVSIPPDFMLYGFDAIAQQHAAETPTACQRRFAVIEGRLGELEAQIARVFTDDGSS